MCFNVVCGKKQNAMGYLYVGLEADGVEPILALVAALGLAFFVFRHWGDGGGGMATVKKTKKSSTVTEVRCR